MMNTCMIAEPKAFYFAGPLREPEVVIVANDEIEAKAEFKKLAGKVTSPRKAHSVIIASPDIRDMLEIRHTGDTPKAPYEATNEDEFPLLSFFGRRSITPTWVIDRRSGKVAISGEYQSLPRELLDLSEKPSAAEIVAAGGKIESPLDVNVAVINERMPWLHLEDGEDLRERLIAECELWERRYGS